MIAYTKLAAPSNKPLTTLVGSPYAASLLAQPGGGDEVAQKIRLWEVTAENTIREITSDSDEGDGKSRRRPADGSIRKEEHLEDWLASNIGMLDPDLLVIGRQVRTVHGSFIDLLCIDPDGALVVVELKKGKTPREVTAQALDYASWVKDLGAEEIVDIADGYLREAGPLAEAFAAKFNVDLPEVINESHRSVVVAETIDESTERIVRYLADLSVPINVATVQHFKDSSGRQMLAKVYLVEPEVAGKVRAGSKRTRAVPRAVKLEQQQALADKHGIGRLFAALREGVAGVLRPRDDYDSPVRYRLDIADRPQLVTLMVGSDRSDDGGMPFVVQVDRVTEHLGMSRELLESVLPDNAHEDRGVKWRGVSAEEGQNAIYLSGTFHNTDEVAKFADAVQAAARNLP